MIENLAVFGVLAVLVIVLAAWLSPRLGVATPVLLVLVGIAVSFIPGAPELAINPEVILTIVLPPLLYSAAVNVPLREFRRNVRPIAFLSVGLVIVSALACGAFLWWLVPGLGLAPAIAIGAVISPPDAVAATSIAKRLGLPPRLVTVLEGEGLVNDATALVLLRTAIAAMATSVTFWGVVGDFVYKSLVGVLLGLAIGFISVRVRSHLDQPVLTTAISFVVPFLAFFPAEFANASGVLAVVAAGLVTGHEGARHLSAGDRISERVNWLTVQLLLENGVFLVMGYQIRLLVLGASHGSLGVVRSVIYGLACCLVLLGVRTLMVLPLIASMEREQVRASERADLYSEAIDRQEALPTTDRTRVRTRWLRRKHADNVFLAEQGLGWRGGAIIAWSGMRGVVTLAAAQTLPVDIAFRNEAILLAFTVAIVTLIVHGTTLPLAMRALRVGDAHGSSGSALHDLSDEIVEAGMALLDDPHLRRADGSAFDADVVAAAKDRGQSLRDSLQTGDPDDVLAQKLELRRLVLNAQQDALLEARALGVHNSEVLARAQRFLDLQLAVAEGE